MWTILILLVSSVSLATCQDIQRTIVMFRANTNPGESMFIRGGIDHSARAGCFDDAKLSPCAIPIVHRVVPTDGTSQYAQWSAGDEFLDWYGYETGQGLYQGEIPDGTPLIYTTNVQDGTTVEDDGYGYTPLNRFGPNYWMLDVDMDCSLTESGWFEFKGFVYPNDFWETDRSQYPVCAGIPTVSQPYASANHLARCGKMNVFYLLEDECNVFDIPQDPTQAPIAGCGQRRMFEIPPSGGLGTDIVNGDPAVVGRWPWQGVLQYGTSIGGCAASLIDSNWAITAGHCVRGTDPAILRVRFGEQNLYIDQNNEQVIPVTDIIQHPRFDQNLPGDVNGDYDIAMLPLASPVDGSSFVVNEACLPYGYALDAFVGLSTCWATGFGSTLDTGESFRLNEINVPVHSHADCVARYGSDYISERQVCMGTDTLSPCGGDSGGPLVCYDNGQWLLVGITSWGEDGCQNGPGVYTRITELLDWIDSVRGSYQR